MCLIVEYRNRNSSLKLESMLTENPLNIYREFFHEKLENKMGKNGVFVKSDHYFTKSVNAMYYIFSRLI